MAWERKMMRTIRVRNEQKVGTLARLLAAVSSMHASVGSIELISETAQSVVRDITVYADDAEHMDHVIEAMRVNEGTRVLEVRDVSVPGSIVLDRGIARAEHGAQLALASGQEIVEGRGQARIEGGHGDASLSMDSGTRATPRA